MQHVSNVMENGGSIVNISSLTGANPAPGYIAYGGAKAGVIHATKIAAVELASRGIRVNVVSPTVVLTPLVQKMFAVPGFEAALLEEHPLGEYIKRGMLVTLNTDDPEMFETTLNREYELAAQVFGLSQEQMKKLAEDSRRAAFLPKV
jgi:NAD(P)-dependent dehydrogenase (short-subunit alcohol dehydrogenase family)